MSAYYLYVWGFEFQPIYCFSRISIGEKDLSMVENKYTLRIKSFENGMGDDGYKWRKYGQKSIKNSPNPRYIRN